MVGRISGRTGDDMSYDQAASDLRGATVSMNKWRNGVHDDGPSGAARANHLHQCAEAAANAIEALTAERDRLRAAISHAMTELGQSAQDVHAIRAEAALARALAQQEGAKG